MALGGPKWVPREARERPKKGLGEAQHTTQEDTRAEKPRQEDTSGDKTTEDKTRGKTRQQTDKRSSGATKPRTPWPVSNLLLVHLMHGSTLVYTPISRNTKLREYDSFSGILMFDSMRFLLRYFVSHPGPGTLA